MKDSILLKINFQILLKSNRKEIGLYLFGSVLTSVFKIGIILAGLNLFGYTPVEELMAFDVHFSNALIIHKVTNQSGYANLATCVRLETPMEHWTEAFPLHFDEISNPRA